MSRAEEVRIIHCADLHLGSDIRLPDGRGVVRQQEIFRSFEKIIGLCGSEKADFLLIAGDLFDRIHISDAIAGEVTGLIASIPDTVVAIAPGNHDPYSVDSCYHLKPWPSNAVIFNGPLSSVTFRDKGVCLWGCGFTGAFASGLWETADPVRDDSLIHLGVMHGDLASSAPQSPYNPIPQSFIAGSGLDYLALGHVHRRSPVARIGRTWHAYAGCPDGRGFDETGALGVYAGTVGHGTHRLRFERICAREYTEEILPVGDFTSNTALAETILAEIRRRRPASYGADLLRIVLTGRLPRAAAIDTAGIAAKLSDELFYVQVEDRTGVAEDYESIASAESLKGLFVRRMLAKRSADADPETADLYDRALRYGLNAFEGEVKIDAPDEDLHP